MARLLPPESASPEGVAREIGVGAGTLVKMAEFMVDLNKMGINRLGMGRYSPQPKELLAATRRLYGLE